MNGMIDQRCEYRAEHESMRTRQTREEKHDIPYCTLSSMRKIKFAILQQHQVHTSCILLHTNVASSTALISSSAVSFYYVLLVESFNDERVTLISPTTTTIPSIPAGSLPIPRVVLLSCNLQSHRLRTWSLDNAHKCASSSFCWMERHYGEPDILLSFSATQHHCRDPIHCLSAALIILYPK